MMRRRDYRLLDQAVGVEVGSGMGDASVVLPGAGADADCSPNAVRAQLPPHVLNASPAQPMLHAARSSGKPTPFSNALPPVAARISNQIVRNPNTSRGGLTVAFPPELDPGEREVLGGARGYARVDGHVVAREARPGQSARAAV